MFLNQYLVLCILLFITGVVGVLVKRNALVMFMSIEMMLNSVNLLLAAISASRGDTAGQVFVIFIMVVAAAEVAVGLAILVHTYRDVHSIDMDLLDKLKG